MGFFKWLAIRKQRKIDQECKNLLEYFRAQDWGNFCELRDKMISKGLISAVQATISTCIIDQNTREMWEDYNTRLQRHSFN